MIYTVTLNPSLDHFLVVESLAEDDTCRVIEEAVYPAGKGIDVSRVINELGGHSVAMGFVGGYHGMQLEGLLINAGIVCDFTRISGETRANVILREQRACRQFVIGVPGPVVQAVEIGDLYHHLQTMGDIEQMALCGSLPQGVTPNLYGQIIRTAKERGSFVLLDTDGPTLVEAIGYQPDCIKPNRHELSRLSGRNIQSDQEALAVCQELHERGLSLILVSLGGEGLLCSQPGQRYKVWGPRIEAQSTVGAGDSAVAGFLWARAQGLELPECLRLACAAGTATACTVGTELCHQETVHDILPQVQVVALP